MRHRASGFRSALRIALVAAGVFCAVPAGAATFQVDSTADAVDGNVGDGVCAAIVGGACTLRAAIQETNALSGSHTIVLPAGTFTLSLAGADEDNAATGDLDIRGSADLTITGAGVDVTIVDAATLDRVLDINKSAGSVIIDGLTITNGRVNGNGAGVLNTKGNVTLINAAVVNNGAWPITDAQGTHHGIGGGIFNDFAGAMVLDNTRVIRNAARYNNGYYDWPSDSITGGGGIRNMGDMVIRNGSRIEDNIGIQFGGGISNSGTLEMLDSVVQFNAGDNTSAGANMGGGIANWGGTLSLRHSVVSDNNAANSGGGIYNYDGNDSRGSLPGVVVIIDSAVDNNTAQLAIGGGIANYSNMYIGYSSVSWNRVSGGYGAGIGNDGNAELSIENTSIVGNFLPVLGGHGGGISTGRGLNLNQVTITANVASVGREIFVNTSEFNAADPREWLNIRNSIIGDDAYLQTLLHPSTSIVPDTLCGGGYSAATQAGVAGQPPDITQTTDYLGLVRSGGYNIEDGNSCGLVSGADQLLTPPTLGEAGDHGGEALPVGEFLPVVLSRVPQAGSPAIDAVALASCTPRFDQRNWGRPTGGACDIGAVESNAVAVPYADLSVKSYANPAWFVGDENITYTMVITNYGNAATGVLSGSANAMNTGFQLQKMDVLAFTYAATAGGTVTCTAIAKDTTNCAYDTAMSPGDSLTLNVTAKPQLSGTHLRAEATVTLATPGDPVSFNNTAVWEHQMVGNKNLLEPNTGIGAMDLIMLPFLAGVWLWRVLLQGCAVARRRIGLVLLLAAWAAPGYAVPPTITSVTPATGTATADTIITITGTNFDPNARIALLGDPSQSAVSAALTPTASTQLVHKQGNLAFLGTAGGALGDSLAVYDVSNPLAPVQLSSRSPAVGLPVGTVGGGTTPFMGGLAVRNDGRVYTSLAEGITIWDYSVPATPALVKRMRGLTLKNGLHADLSSGIPNPLQFGMDVSGDLLYIARNDHNRTIADLPGLYIVDTSKVQGPHVLGRLIIDNVGRIKVATIGISTYAYLVAGGALDVVNVTDPANPALLATYAGPPDSLGAPQSIFDMDIVVAGTTVTAVVAAANGIATYDLSPATGYANTAPLGVYDLPVGTGQSFAYPTLIKAQGNDVIVHTPSGNYPTVPFSVLWHLDITDATAPKLVGGPYADDFYPWSLDYDAGYIYSGAHVIKTNPVLTNITITSTTITATVPAGYRAQNYDVVITNPMGQAEETRMTGGFVVP